MKLIKEHGGISIPENPNGTTADVTSLYNTPTGYMASTTGNITGIYDTSGGVWGHCVASGVFAFSSDSGRGHAHLSFHIVLTP